MAARSEATYGLCGGPSVSVTRLQRQFANQHLGVLDIPRGKAYVLRQFGELKDEAFLSFSSEGDFYSPTSLR
jgi:hypothetical protein